MTEDEKSACEHINHRVIDAAITRKGQTIGSALPTAIYNTMPVIQTED